MAPTDHFADAFVWETVARQVVAPKEFYKGIIGKLP